MQHATRAVLLLEVGKVLRIGIVRQLRLFLRVQVIEVAEELVEAVHRRQVLVAVAEMVLPELSGGVAERLQQFRNVRILRPHAQFGAPGSPTLVSPVRNPHWPVMKDARPAVQLCSP